MVINKLLDRVISGERQIKSPIFIKDFSEENLQLNDLISLHKKLINGTKKEWIERDITFMKEGLRGEKNVYYELKNSFLPILCLHDIRLEYGDYIAQFDFIVISHKFICILETKKLSGNIVINQDGDFIRVIKNKNGKEIKREGMYSPISQNRRQLDILNEILVKEKLVKRWPLKSLVVLANSRTIINKENCPETIVDSIYRYDQIVNCLKNFQDDKENRMNVLESNMYKIADFLLANHKPLTIDYSLKYGLSNDDYIKETKKNKDQLHQLLKEYRLKKSKEEKVKAYLIFNNKQMEDLIEKYPTTEEELHKVNGFGPKKVEKYGRDILSIFTAN